eukprot:jgi/Mesen1/1997/ME000147S01086
MATCNFHPYYGALASIANAPSIDRERQGRGSQANAGDCGLVDEISASDQHNLSLLCGDFNEEDLLKHPPLGLTLRKSGSFLELLSKQLAKHDPVSPQRNEPEGSPVHMENALHMQAGCSMGKVKYSTLIAESITIGAWKQVSQHEEHIVAKFQYAQRKLIWEVLEEGLKSKMEVDYDDISFLRATYLGSAPSILEVWVRHAPAHHSMSTSEHREQTTSEDFTHGVPAAPTRHLLTFPEGSLGKHFDQLRTSDPRLDEMAIVDTAAPAAVMHFGGHSAGHHWPLSRVRAPAVNSGMVQQGPSAGGSSPLMGLARRSVQAAPAMHYAGHPSVTHVVRYPLNGSSTSSSGAEGHVATALHPHLAPGPYRVQLPPSHYEMDGRALPPPAGGHYYYAAGHQLFGSHYHQPGNPSLTQVVSQVAPSWSLQAALPAASSYPLGLHPPHPRNSAASPHRVRSEPSRPWDKPKTGSAAAGPGGGSSKDNHGRGIPKASLKRAATAKKRFQPPPAKRARNERCTAARAHLVMYEAGGEKRFVTLAEEAEAVAAAAAREAAQQAEAAAMAAAMAASIAEAEAAAGLTSVPDGAKGLITEEAAGMLPAYAFQEGEFAASEGTGGAATRMQGLAEDLSEEEWDGLLMTDGQVVVPAGMGAAEAQEDYFLMNDVSDVTNFSFFSDLSPLVDLAFL